jgi:phosphoserine aminotransferase
MKKHNFNPGPSILSSYTIENSAKAVMDFNGSGLSILEISHRSKEFIAVTDEAISLFKELLHIPDGYSVLFLQGGASLQFMQVPYNLLNKKAGYLDTGSWASKAAKEAKFFGEVVIVASSRDRNYAYIPKDFNIPADLDYLHITTNNTIFGTELKKDPDVKIPLVADMSSDIFSRPVDVSKYALIYGGAQKNLAPAGMTFVIVKNDILGKVDRPLPSMMDYRVHIENETMYNTPPCFTIYSALQTLKWYKEMGGIEAMHKVNLKKADMLYAEIDRNKLFKGTVETNEDRSIMNVCFVMSDNYKDKEDDFSKFASSKGMVGLKGHRSVGGFRASIYNAMPVESVQALISCMKEYESAI